MTDSLEHPLFVGVAREVVERMLAGSFVRQLEANATVLGEDEPGDHFFILTKGSVKVFYQSPDGTEVIVKLFRAPAVFGEMECLSEIGYLESVETLERSQVVDVPRAVFLAALSGSHALTYNLLTDLAARLCIAAQNERSLAFHPVEVRLANMIGTYVEMYGLPVPEGIKIRIPLSQDDLANALGVARRSVTRALKAWTDDGIIAKDGRYFVVRALDRLEAHADQRLLRINHRTGSGIGKKIERRK